MPGAEAERGAVTSTAGTALSGATTSRTPLRQSSTPPDPPLRWWQHGWPSVASATAVLAVGMAASVAGGWQVDRSARQATMAAFATQAQTVSASVSTAIRRDLDFVAVQQGLVTSLPQLTNRALASWYRSIDLTSRYPGAVGFGFVERVPAAQLARFEDEVLADPLIGTTMRAPYVVVPAGKRPYYCLQRFSDTVSDSASRFAPPTFDLCSPTLPDAGASPLSTLFEQAEDRGQPEVLDLERSAFRRLALPDLFAVYAPTYDDGGVPPTVSLRRQQLFGWMVGAFDGDVILDSALGSAVSTLDVTLEYDGPHGPTVMASDGRVGPGPAVATTSERFHSDVGAWIVRVVGPVSASGRAEGLVVAGLGLFASLLLFAVVVLLGRSRGRALRLVGEQTEQLRYLALHDPLTGLANRTLILDRADQMLRKARREPRSVGAMFIDLDNFKNINDTFGHPVGDALLRAVGDRLAGVLRASDTIGRIGGDEFLVLAEGDADDAGPEAVADRILTALHDPVLLDELPDVPITIRTSVGVAVGTRGDAEELLRDADVALYAAKAAGKDCHVVFQPEMQACLQQRLTRELDLRRGVDADEFRLSYLPICRLADLRPLGVEALLRWRHPRRGVLEPAEFLALAEETGLIVSLGRQVLTTACADAGQWQRRGVDVGVSVNVSGRQLADRSFVDDVAEALSSAGLAPGSLTLDVTESVLLHGTTVATQRLHDVKRLGVRLAVDDFGTGYASLVCLRDFPLDAVKIDQSLVAASGGSQEVRSIIRALLEVARSLGLDTMAEGVERDGQLRFLRAERCRLGQGVLLSAALDADDVGQALRPVAT